MIKLIKMSVLKEQFSPWSANNIFIPMKYCGVWVTTDFRALNNVTVTDAYRMGDVQATLDWLVGKKVYSIFDLKDGFYKVELSKESRPLSAVRTLVGQLQYTQLLQGLKNSPGTFQRIFKTVLPDRKGKNVLSYVDGTRVDTENEEDHLKSLYEIPPVLYKIGVRLQLSKCLFEKRKVEFLCHKVTQNGILPSGRHLKSIQELVEPVSGNELKNISWLCQLFLAIHCYYAEMARPLYVLKGTEFSRKRRPGKKFVKWTGFSGGARNNRRVAFSEAMS